MEIDPAQTVMQKIPARAHTVVPLVLMLTVNLLYEGLAGGQLGGGHAPARPVSGGGRAFL